MDCRYRRLCRLLMGVSRDLVLDALDVPELVPEADGVVDAETTELAEGVGILLLRCQCFLVVRWRWKVDGVVGIVTAELVVEVGVVDEDVVQVEANADVGLGDVPSVVDEVD